ncbi:unnamed protein product [Caretta caretta]
MKQLLALSPVLCIVLLIPTWAAAGLGVSQEPRSLNMTAGENMTLSCTFQTRDSKRTKVLWLRGSGEDLELDSNHPFYRGRLRVSRMDEHRQGKATLTLAELQERDSGLYQCCIELDRGETGMGGGTELRVMRRNQSATGGSEGGRERGTRPVPSRGRHPRNLLTPHFYCLGAAGERELCRVFGPLFYRAIISLSFVVLFSLGIILSLRPWNAVPVDPAVGAGSKPPPAPGQVSLI